MSIVIFVPVMFAVALSITVDPYSYVLFSASPSIYSVTFTIILFTVKLTCEDFTTPAVPLTYTVMLFEPSFAVNVVFGSKLVLDPLPSMYHHSSAVSLAVTFSLMLAFAYVTLPGDRIVTTGVVGICCSTLPPIPYGISKSLAKHVSFMSIAQNHFTCMSSMSPFSLTTFRMAALL